MVYGRRIFHEIGTYSVSLSVFEREARHLEAIKSAVYRETTVIPRNVSRSSSAADVARRYTINLFDRKSVRARRYKGDTRSRRAIYRRYICIYIYILYDAGIREISRPFLYRKSVSRSNTDFNLAAWKPGPAKPGLRVASPQRIAERT